MSIGWIVGLLGIWALIAPFVGLGPLGYAWSHWLVGVVCAVLGFAMVNGRPREGWITGFTGFWMFIAGFISGLLTAPGIWWNNLIVGAILVIFGFAATRPAQPMQTAHAR